MIILSIKEYKQSSDRLTFLTYKIKPDKVKVNMKEIFKVIYLIHMTRDLFCINL